MSVLKRRIRLLVAGALVVAGVVGVAPVPAQAVTLTSPITGCSSGGGGSFPLVNNGDLYRIVLTGTSCTHVRVDQLTGMAADVWENANPFAQGSLTALVANSTIEVAVPASGWGSIDVNLFANSLTSAPHHTVTLCYGNPGSLSADLVDNGNGSATYTFSGDNGGCQQNFVDVYPSGTTCPQSGSLQTRLGVLVSDSAHPNGTFAPGSPYLIAGGTSLLVPSNPPSFYTLTPGTYVLCRFQFDQVNFQELEQSLTVTLAANPTPAPVPPAYTG
jgi:hypothetical protein